MLSLFYHDPSLIRITQREDTAMAFRGSHDCVLDNIEGETSVKENRCLTVQGESGGRQ